MWLINVDIRKVGGNAFHGDIKRKDLNIASIQVYFPHLLSHLTGHIIGNIPISVGNEAGRKKEVATMNGLFSLSFFSIKIAPFKKND